MNTMALTEPPYLVEDLIDDLRPDCSRESRLERLAVAKRQDKFKLATTAPFSARESFLDVCKYPTMGDVVILKQFLAKYGPTEIVDVIMSHTEYWPHTTTVLKKPFKSFGKRLNTNIESSDSMLEPDTSIEIQLHSVTQTRSKTTSF